MKEVGVGLQKIMDAGDVEGSYIVFLVVGGGMTMTRPARSKRYAWSRCIWEFHARQVGRAKMELDRVSWNRILCQEVADAGAGENWVSSSQDGIWIPFTSSDWRRAADLQRLVDMYEMSHL